MQTLIYAILKFYNDYKAIQQGKIKQRIARRIIGKIAGRLMWKIR